MINSIVLLPLILTLVCCSSWPRGNADLGYGQSYWARFDGGTANHNGGSGGAHGALLAPAVVAVRAAATAVNGASLTAAAIN